MTIIEKQTYVVKGTFPSGGWVHVNIVAFSKKQAIRNFLELFCKGKKS